MKKGFTLIELLIVIALIGILSAIGIPAYQGFQATARYNAAKTNHANAVSYVTAEVSKCNNKTTPISFVSKVGTTVSMNCPIAIEYSDGYNCKTAVYFQTYINDHFAKPYFPTQSIGLYLPTSSGGGEGLTWGSMWLTCNNSGSNFEIMTGLGLPNGHKRDSPNKDGCTLWCQDVANEIFSLAD